jgi:hypothetical protein
MNIKLFKTTGVTFKTFSVLLFHLYAVFQLAAYAVQFIFLGQTDHYIFSILFFSICLLMFHRTLQATDSKKKEELYQVYFNLKGYVTVSMIFYFYRWFNATIKTDMEARAAMLEFIAQIALYAFYLSLFVVLRKDKEES